MQDKSFDGQYSSASDIFEKLIQSASKLNEPPIGFSGIASAEEQIAVTELLKRPQTSSLINEIASGKRRHVYGVVWEVVPTSTGANVSYFDHNGNEVGFPYRRGEECYQGLQGDFQVGDVISCELQDVQMIQVKKLILPAGLHKRFVNTVIKRVETNNR